jgi:hypothetical protein
MLWGIQNQLQFFCTGYLGQLVPQHDVHNVFHNVPQITPQNHPPNHPQITSQKDPKTHPKSNPNSPPQITPIYRVYRQNPTMRLNKKHFLEKKIEKGARMRSLERVLVSMLAQASPG